MLVPKCPCFPCRMPLMNRRVIPTAKGIPMQTRCDCGTSFTQVRQCHPNVQANHHEAATTPHLQNFPDSSWLNCTRKPSVDRRIGGTYVQVPPSTMSDRPGSRPSVYTTSDHLKPYLRVGFDFRPHWLLVWLLGRCRTPANACCGFVPPTLPPKFQVQGSHQSLHSGALLDCCHFAIAPDLRNTAALQHRINRTSLPLAGWFSRPNPVGRLGVAFLGTASPLSYLSCMKIKERAR
ncbi:hypothetical protein AB1N83_011547 [Pleurotus pulmonarius]